MIYDIIHVVVISLTSFIVGFGIGVWFYMMLSLAVEMGDYYE